jgi:hypothetical protein
MHAQHRFVIDFEFSGINIPIFIKIMVMMSFVSFFFFFSFVYLTALSKGKSTRMSSLVLSGSDSSGKI